MAEQEMTTESMTGQAADWVSTVLSVPLIWPKATVAASLGTIVFGLGLATWQLRRPAVPPPPPLNPARVAQIEAAVREAEQALQSQVPVGGAREGSGYLGYMHAIADPSHAEKHQ